MHLLGGLFVATTILSPLVSASYIPDIQARNDIAACKAVLIALRASAFCSAFVPIKDVTSTSTVSGPRGTAQVTVTAACRNGPEKRWPRPVTPSPYIPKTPAATPAISTTPAAPSTTSKLTTAPKTTTTTSKSTAVAKCSVKNAHPAVASFACNVVKEACLAFVKPKTVKVTTEVPGTTNTGTITVVPTCTPTTTTRATSSTTPPAVVGRTCENGSTCENDRAYNVGLRSSRQTCITSCENGSHFGEGCITSSYNEETMECTLYYNCCYTYTPGS